jgi:hypothetical protein
MQLGYLRVLITRLPALQLEENSAPDSQCLGKSCQTGLLQDFSQAIDREELLVAEARCVPNLQFLSMPFRSELIHSATLAI